MTLFIGNLIEGNDISLINHHTVKHLSSQKKLNSEHWNVSFNSVEPPPARVENIWFLYRFQSGFWRWVGGGRGGAFEAEEALWLDVCALKIWISYIWYTAIRPSPPSPIYLHICKYVHCKKRLAVFLSPAGMSLTKLSLAGNNLTGLVK